MPSGGDWALQRMGALFFEGTENTLVDSCIFERLDGNGIMISGYNRNVTIQKNEFAWIGDTAIASWGYTSGTNVPGMRWLAQMATNLTSIVSSTTLYMSWVSGRSSLHSTSKPSPVRTFSKVTYSSMGHVQESTLMMALVVLTTSLRVCC